MVDNPAPNSSTQPAKSGTVAGGIQTSAATPQKPRYRQGALKLIVAIVLAAGTFYCISARTDHFAQSQKVASQKEQPSVAGQNAVPPMDAEKATPGMKETNDLLINWAIVVLGATLGIAILAKGAKIRDGNWGLVLFPSAWVFLWASLRKGYEFKASLTYQIAKGALKFPELNLRLYLQLEFFRSSLMVLSVVGLWYLFFRFSLAEEKSNEGN